MSEGKIIWFTRSVLINTENKFEAIVIKGDMSWQT